MTGLGATETAPFAFCTGLGGAFAGFMGFPAPGMELKLAPAGEKNRGTGSRSRISRPAIGGTRS